MSQYTSIFDYIDYVDIACTVTNLIPHEATLMCVNSQFYKCYKKYGKPHYRNFSTWWIIKTNYIAFVSMMSEKTLEYVLIHRKFIEMTHLNSKRKKQHYVWLILGIKYDKDVIEIICSEDKNTPNFKRIEFTHRINFPVCARNLYID